MLYIKYVEEKIIDWTMRLAITNANKETQQAFP